MGRKSVDFNYKVIESEETLDNPEVLFELLFGVSVRDFALNC